MCRSYAFWGSQIQQQEEKKNYKLVQIQLGGCEHYLKYSEKILVLLFEAD